MTKRRASPAGARDISYPCRVPVLSPLSAAAAAVARKKRGETLSQGWKYVQKVRALTRQCRGVLNAGGGGGLGYITGEVGETINSFVAMIPCDLYLGSLQEHAAVCFFQRRREERKRNKVHNCPVLRLLCSFRKKYFPSFIPHVSERVIDDANNRRPFSLIMSRVEVA